MRITHWLTELRNGCSGAVRRTGRNRRDCTSRAVGNTWSGAVAAQIEYLEPRFLLSAIDLATLTAAQGTMIFGADKSDFSSFSLSSAGDVNGDGFDDLIIGAFWADAAGNLKPNAGESYVIFGGASQPATIDLATLGVAGITIFGADANDRSGYSVSSAGDVNGDGFDDLLIGARVAAASGNLKPGAGESYVIFGGASLPSTINLAIPGAAGITIFGADANDGSGFMVSCAGDVNGDGCDDLIIGARKADGAGNLKSDAGESYVIFGGASLPATIDLATLGSAGITIFGADAGDQSGFSVSSAGDVNGDGFDDLIIGAVSADALGNLKPDAGESYVIFGGALLPATIDLATLGSAGITIFGAGAGDYNGRNVSSAGDMNGDGFDDVIIGAYSADGSGSLKPDAGESYVIFGGASLPATIDLATLGAAGITIFGADANDRSGNGVSGAGDVNGDGFDDLLIGAYGADGSGNLKPDAGESYLIFGGTSLSTTIDLATLGSAGVTIFGADAHDYSGYLSLTSAGDVNGDGFDDLLIGALFGRASGNLKPEAGESYLIFGGNGFTSSVTYLGTANAETLTGTSGANVMVGGRGNDMLIGSGGADVLIGGQGNDVLAVSDLSFQRVVGGTGSDTLRLDGSGLSLDLTTLADNRLRGIEMIDLTGTGDNTLTLNLREVLNFSDESNTLTVRGNVGDHVEMGNGWIQGPDQAIGPDTFHVFTQGAATLKVQWTNQNPVFISSNTPIIPENTTAVLTLTANDADLPAQVITFSKTGGTDQDKFAITSGGVLTFIDTPDFEHPTDADTDNVYLVEVTASDGAGGTAVLTLAVTVTDENEVPTANAGGPYTIVPGGTVQLDASGTIDPDQPNSALTYQWDFNGDNVFDDATGITPVFSAAAIDTIGSRTIAVRVTDAGGLTSEATTPLDIVRLARLPDPSDPGKTALFVGGTLGSDTITVDPGTLSGTLKITLQGIGQFDNLFADGDTFVYGLDGSDTFNVNAALAGGLTLAGQGGSDRYTVNFGSLAGTVRVIDDGVSGTDRLTVWGTSGDDAIFKDATIITLGSPVVETVLRAGIETLTIRGGAGHDVITDPGADTEIFGDEGNDTIIINATDGTGVFVDGGEGSDSYVVASENLNGPVTIVDTGTTGSDNLTVQGTAGDDTIVQTSDGLTVNGVAVSFSGELEGLTVDGGSGSDAFVVEGTSPLPVQVQGVSDMIIQGTAGNDTIAFTPGASGGQIVATLNGVVVARFSPTGRLIAYGDAGNDDIQVAGGINLSAWLYGDGGDDRLNAGNASPGGNLLFGGDGNDELLGGSGRDIMIGGQGADKITGNANDDILIAGLTTFDSRTAFGHDDFWCRVMDTWTDINVEFLDRVYALRTATGANLLASIMDDSTADQIDMLQGSSGNDWFLYKAGEDKVAGQTEATN